MPHGTRWTLPLLFALLAPAVAGAGAQPHYSGWDLDRNFADIRRKLRAIEGLEARDKATLRRVNAIEAALRDIRTNVKSLELHLRTMDSTLAELRKELAVLRGSATQVAGTTETPGVTEDGDTPKGPEDPLAEITNERSSSSGTFRTITGLVSNLSDRPLTFVVVEARFLDAKGNVIKTESAYTSPRVIGPGAKAAFKIHTRSDRRIRRHQLTVKAK